MPLREGKTPPHGRSTVSTPRPYSIGLLNPSSYHDIAHFGSSNGAANDDMETSGGLASLHLSRMPGCSAPSSSKSCSEGLSSIPVKRAKEKKKKTPMPRNALQMLAGSGGGAPPHQSHVVDLRALDPSPCGPSGSRSPRSSDGTRRVLSRNEDPPATQILDFLYLGTVKDAQDADFLARHHVRYIINVSQEEYWSVDKKVQIVTFRIDDTASADIASLFQPTRDFINTVRARYYRYVEDDRPVKPTVLVHCQKGRSRSATIVMAYLMYCNGWSVAETMQYVQRRRPTVEPNIGFMEELRKLQERMDADDRTRRYSELCVFLRNLSPVMKQQQLRDLFEKRIGQVRDVVMHSCGGGSGHDRGGATERQLAKGEEGDEAPSAPSAPATSGNEEATSVPRVKSITCLDPEEGADPDSCMARPTHPATVHRCSGEKYKLSFIFFACREDVLRGVKSGQLKRLMQQLQPSPGKEVRLSTGPKLRKLMEQHQSMSYSFSDDIAALDGTLSSGEPEHGREVVTGVDGPS